jgi:hypothetical protein
VLPTGRKTGANHGATAVIWANLLTTAAPKALAGVRSAGANLQQRRVLMAPTRAYQNLAAPPSLTARERVEHAKHPATLA